MLLVRESLRHALKKKVDVGWKNVELHVRFIIAFIVRE